MDDNCGVGGMYGCGEQEVGVASGSGWNLWVWLLGVVVRRYIDFLILLIPTPLVSVLFYSSIPIYYTLTVVVYNNNNYYYIIKLKEMSPYKRTEYKLCWMSCDQIYIMFAGFLQSTDTQDDSNM